MPVNTRRTHYSLYCECSLHISCVTDNILMILATGKVYTHVLFTYYNHHNHDALFKCCVLLEGLNTFSEHNY